jgi:biopolymer transport protein TolQ
MDIAFMMLQLGGGAQGSIPSLIAHASLFSKAVLLLLLGMSVYSWAVLWDRLRLYAAVSRQDQAFLTAFRSLAAGADCRLIAAQHPQSLFARAALAGQAALEKLPSDAGSAVTRYDLVQRAMDRAANDELGRLEMRVGFLGTTGSVAPFIGLMGTVWGVMAAFMNIGSQGSASLAVVAPGIAEALIATIAGLAAAIPSVIGYNQCLGRLRDMGNHAGSFASEFLDRRIGAQLK